MKTRSAESARPWPRWARAVVIATGALILSSCQSSHHLVHGPSTSPADCEGPSSEWSGGLVPGLAAAQVSSLTADCLAPPGPPAPWRPPGIRGPWPADEYLCDGNDFGVPFSAHPAGHLNGLEQADTVAYYDTVDGRRIVEPTNRVCVYAPRFGVVRRIDKVAGQEVHHVSAALGRPLQPVRLDDGQEVQTRRQPLKPAAGQSARSSSLHRGREQSGGLDIEEGISRVHDDLIPNSDRHRDPSVRIQSRTKAITQQGLAAARAWSQYEELQVIIDKKRATMDIGELPASVVYRVNEPDRPRLRVQKGASTASAHPGETVDFMIRFQNVGNQAIHNLTLVDHLTTRFEFVPGSAKSNPNADFIAIPNPEGSSTLQWAMQKELAPGESGEVRFRVKVR